MSEELHWLAGEGRVELLIRKSRFLGVAAPCETEAAAAEQLAGLRTAHPKATHHVSAYRLRDAATGLITHRFDDDGEPGGTAGRPLLQVLESRQVVNAGLVVVRYFGGIKLGAGGLVRAYSEAGAKALDAGELHPLIPTSRIAATVPFPRMATLEHWAERHGLPIRDRRFGTAAVLVVEVPTARLTEFKRELADLTGGEAEIQGED